MWCSLALLLSACSPLESLGYDYVEVTEDGSVVVGQDGYDEGVRAVLESEDTTTWQREPAPSNVDWELTTASCNPNDDQVCIELGPGNQINVSTDGGATFQTEWQIADGGNWTPGRHGSEFFSGEPLLFRTTDIAWTDDGRAFVAMSDRYPVVRNVDGSFTPSIADLHPYPVISMVFIIGSWVIAAIGLLILSKRASRKGIIGFAISSICFFATGVFVQFDILGLLASRALLVGGVISFIVALVMAFAAPPPPRAPGQLDQTIPALRLLWPFPALLALGYTWDIDLLRWLAMSALMAGVLATAIPLVRPQAKPAKSESASQPALS